jgi:hypothetical protein
MTEEEQRLIQALQRDIADVKKTMARMVGTAGDLVTVLHKAGLREQCGDALILQGELGEALGKVRMAHGRASKALVRGFGEAGGEIIAAGPIR